MFRTDKIANPFLAGVHTPMQAELTIEDLAVTGTIPPALDGRYLRMGPNPMSAAKPAKRHWFAGDGMIHGLRIENGRALWYRNRWIRSDDVTKALGEPRTPGPRHLFDTVNTNAIGFAGKTFGLIEAGGTPVEIGETLETLRYTDFDGGLHGGFAAHPHVDPATGEMLAVCYDAKNWRELRFVAVTPEGQVRREVKIPVKHGPMIHDFAFTRRFAIILDLPVTFSLRAAITGYSFPYRWNDAHKPRIGLLPREGEAKDIVWIPVDPCFVFHTVNAYDRADGSLVIDLVVHDRIFATSKVGPDSRHCALERWIVDPAKGAIERIVIDDTPQEFPRPDERRLGRPYRYAYTMAMVGDFLGAGLFKHDLEAGTRQIHDFGPNRHPCEFVFVPTHAEAEEDEGWLIGLVIDAAAKTTDLVILNARDFAGEPQASIRLPHIVPPGFHGNWVAN
ncbi:carotenoid oxygenase family protein [Nitrospirillum sp. BR 11163]|uniref:8'-apo-carotenoid 13,14-cleaving dioxygenase n=1 Tax=Nitrospirillum sp. BR 11163 TaxID=3104323 RepID=UPI002AFEA28B|nr:carotenoid oxygenase family protein [Nitrospirillum sp. BR 11163]MEA1675946.1 carotenoid oxygenase family protein [Nitrospirillum sp. BR 11163]